MNSVLCEWEAALDQFEASLDELEVFVDAQLCGLDGPMPDPFTVPELGPMPEECTARAQTLAERARMLEALIVDARAQLEKELPTSAPRFRFPTPSDSAGENLDWRL